MLYFENVRVCGITVQLSFPLTKENNKVYVCREVFSQSMFRWIDPAMYHFVWNICGRSQTFAAADVFFVKVLSVPECTDWQLIDGRSCDNQYVNPYL